jgi:hypothetical protein
MSQVSYGVFPTNIYAADIIFPRPYYSYEPKGSYSFLSKTDRKDPDPYKASVYGWQHTPQGYFEGNLQGHICEDECRSMPDIPYVGTLTHTGQKCWCSGPFKDRCSSAFGFVPPPWKTETEPKKYEWKCQQKKF